MARLQSFISFQMRLAIINKLMGRDVKVALSELIQLQELCQNQVTELRDFVRSMRPADEGMSLNASIGRMVDLFQRDSGISSTYVAGEFHDPPQTEVSLELLQIVREALNNIQKHSGASRVALAAARKEDRLEVVVEDNGSGLPFSGTFSLEELELLHLGPLSIRRRVRMLGGDLAITSNPRPRRQAGDTGPVVKPARWPAALATLLKYVRLWPIAAAALATCSCGRYADFTLPAPDAAGMAGTVQMGASTLAGSRSRRLRVNGTRSTFSILPWCDSGIAT